MTHTPDTCHGPWMADTTSLVDSNNTKVRARCPHGFSIWLDVDKAPEPERAEPPKKWHSVAVTCARCPALIPPHRYGALYCIPCGLDVADEREAMRQRREREAAVKRARPKVPGCRPCSSTKQGPCVEHGGVPQFMLRNRKVPVR